MISDLSWDQILGRLEMHLSVIVRFTYINDFPYDRDVITYVPCIPCTHKFKKISLVTNFSLVFSECFLMTWLDFLIIITVS